MIVRSAYRVEVQPLREFDPPPPPPKTIDWLYVASQCAAPKSRRLVTVASIRARVEEFYGLQPGSLTTAVRTRKIAHARQVAMYFARELTPKSLPELGRRFGGRDHTTVLHGIRAVEKRIKADGELAVEIEALREGLAG